MEIITRDSVCALCSNITYVMFLCLNSDDDSWKDLVENPKNWWDNRSRKVTLNPFFFIFFSFSSSLAGLGDLGDVVTITIICYGYLPLYSFLCSGMFYSNSMPYFLCRSTQNLQILNTKIQVKHYGLLTHHLGHCPSCRLWKLNQIN